MAQTGQSATDVIEDVLAGYFQELDEVRTMLASRYDDFKSGKTIAISGEEALSRLERKSEERRAALMQRGE
jgi:hypothetical protein